MPTLLSTFNPAGGEVKMRYQEPYVTEGLNAKFARVVPRGTHRGFRLSTNAAALTLTVSADTTTLDHVAQYLTTDGHALTIRRTGGDFAVTLPANNTYIIAILASYVVGSTTTAVLNAYTLTEYNALTATQQQELVVLGTVVSPVAGVIPAANITHFRRTWGYMDVGPDAVPFLPLLADPGFEMSGLPSSLNVNGIPGVWNYVDSSGVAPFLAGNYTNTDPSGENQFTLTSSAAGTFTATLTQYTNSLPVTTGQTIRAVLSVKNLSIPTSGTITVLPVYLDSSGNPVATPDAYSISLAGTDANYRTIDTTFQVPANALYLVGMQLSVNAVAWTVGAAVFRLNAFQAFIERGVANATNGRTKSDGNVQTLLRLLQPGAAPSAADPIIREGGTISVADPFPYSGEKVQLDRADFINDATHLPPAWYPHGPVVAGVGIADQSIARVVVTAQPGASNRTLLIGSKHPTAKGEWRLYITDLGVTEHTLNAIWDPVALHWTQDDATKASVRWTMSDSASFTQGLMIEQVGSGAGTWTSWGTQVFSAQVFNSGGLGGTILTLGNATGGTGSIAIQGDNTLGTFGPNIQLATNYAMTATDAPSVDTLYAKNIVKAWGFFTGSLVGPPYGSLLDGYNVASVAAAAGTTQTVTFATAMADTNYAVVLSIDNNTVAKVISANRTVNGFDADFYRTDTNAGINNNSGGNNWCFVVLGKQ